MWAIVTQKFETVVQNCELENWKEALAVVLTYAAGDNFNKLCGEMKYFALSLKCICPPAELFHFSCFMFCMPTRDVNFREFYFSMREFQISRLVEYSKVNAAFRCGRRTSTYCMNDATQ